MRFIENPDLREWVKESLQRAVFQKAHELAVQTGCEVLVKLQDATDRSAQYYATRTLRQQYQGKGLSRQPWDVQVSGITGLPKTLLAEKGCQSDGDTAQDVKEEEEEEEEEDAIPMMMMEMDPGLPGQRADLATSASDNQGEQSRFDTGSNNSSSSPPASSDDKLDGMPAGAADIKVESEGQELQALPYQYGVESDQVDAGRGEGGTPTLDGAELADLCAPMDQRGEASRDSSDPDSAVPVELHTAATYPIGFPINRMQAMTKSVDDRIQPPYPTQGLTEVEGSLSNPPEGVPLAGTGPCGPELQGPLPALKPYQCGICLKNFETIQILSGHAQVNHGLDQRMSFLCDICGQGYKQAQHLQHHMQMHRSALPYICFVCNRGFFNAARLARHERAHEQLRQRHRCRACFQFFAEVVDLQRHFRQVHGGPGIKDDSQPPEQRPAHPEAPTNETLSDPMDRAVSDRQTVRPGHPQEMPSQPGASTMRPIFPQNVTQHGTNSQLDNSVSSLTGNPQRDGEGGPQMAWQQTNPGEGGLDHGASTTGTASGARHHARNLGLFSGRTPSSGLLKINRHVCNICGKSYKYNFTLREHLLTHSSVPQFVCKICGKTFTRQRLLRDHMFRHSGTYPYHCELCGKGFIRPSTMKRHQTDRHRMLHDVAV